LVALGSVGCVALPCAILFWLLIFVFPLLWLLVLMGALDGDNVDDAWDSMLSDDVFDEDFWDRLVYTGVVKLFCASLLFCTECHNPYRLKTRESAE
jgi:hypothetical protein